MAPLLPLFTGALGPVRPASFSSDPIPFVAEVVIFPFPSSDYRTVCCLRSTVYYLSHTIYQTRDHIGFQRKSSEDIITHPRLPFGLRPSAAAVLDSVSPQGPRSAPRSQSESPGVSAACSGGSRPPADRSADSDKSAPAAPR